MGSLAARHSSKSARKHAAVVNLTVKAFIESVSDFFFFFFFLNIKSNDDM